MIKLVAFDWNGTIFSDTKAVVECVNIVFKDLNLRPVSLKSFRNHFDVPVTRTYLELGVPESLLKKKAAEAVKTFHSYYEIRAKHIRTRAYARAVLKWLSKNQIKSIIFSNHVKNQSENSLRDYILTIISLKF